MNANSSPAVELRGLSKTYRPPASAPVHALVHMTLAVPAGQLVGIVGPNGAGKTTLLRLIAGALRPTAGQVQVWGFDLLRERGAGLRQVGAALEAVPQRRSKTSVGEYLMRCGQVLGLEATALELHIGQLLHDLGLGQRRADQLGALCSSERRKVALARALLADPPIIVFDDPLGGLDTHSTQAVQQWIVQLAHERGKTVLLTTSAPRVAGAMCERVLVMRQGCLVGDLPAATLCSLLRGDRYQIRVKGQLGSQWSQWFDGLTVMATDGDETILQGKIADQAALLGLIGKIRDLGLPLLAVTPEELSLDAVFDS